MDSGKEEKANQAQSKLQHFYFIKFAPIHMNFITIKL